MKRMYAVGFEAWDNGKWSRWFSRTVCVNGGAEQAIKEAVKRNKADRARVRVEEVRLLATED